MKQVYLSDVSATPPALPAGAVEGFPQDGTLTGSHQATVPGAYWFHMISSELENAITAGGLTPDASKTNQLADIIGGMHAAMNAVSYLPQTLTDEQKRQAKANIDAVGVSAAEFGAVGDGTTDDSAAITAALSALNGRYLDGEGKVFRVDALPDDFARLRNIALKVGNVVYPSRDFLPLDAAKVSSAGLYTAWPQDKCYVLNDQIRVWAMQALAHRSAQKSLVCFYSDDGGVSWSPTTYLNRDAYSGWVAYSGGVGDGYEFLIAKTSDDIYASTSYKLFRRAVPAGEGVGQYDDGNPWTVKDIAFPMPSWETQYTIPFMVHSFTSNGSRIVVGASFHAGVGLYYSDDYGDTWTLATVIANDTNAEEITVKHDPATGLYCGFIRAGDNTECKYWSSADLATFNVVTVPAGFFGSVGLQDSCIPFEIVDGVIHAFTTHRKGNTTDEDVPIYYITGNVSAGNFWQDATCYQIGLIDHREGAAGASACGQGSVVAYKNKIFYFFGNEERTGNSSTSAGYNRIANIFCVRLSLGESFGAINSRRIEVENRAAPSVIAQDFNRTNWIFPQRTITALSTIPTGVAPPTDLGFGVDCGQSARNMYVLTGQSSTGVVGFMIRNPDQTASGIRSVLSNGDATITAQSTQILRVSKATATVCPNTTKAYSLGKANMLWTEVFAETGAINTSDERMKANIGDPSEALMRAWGRIGFKVFQFKDSVAKKGADARIHVGVIAQQVREAFAAEGLDADRFGLFCYDKWDARPAEIDPETGEEIEPAVEAGDAYGIRYEEALALECAYQRWRLAKIEERLG